MLFNSYIFIFVFLPVTLSVFFVIGKVGHHRVAISWLVGASLFFYGWWNPSYLGLILFSILLNYSIGIMLSSQSKHFGITKKGLLIFGIISNLTLLGYFKYANFFINNINTLTNFDFNLGHIILPLAISFFTFQQIAYLVDAYRGETKEYNFLHYCLFVTFFPQLIAGPIVHHREMLPQFSKDKIYNFNFDQLTIGMTIFLIGLFKKVIIADKISIYASPVFNAAEAGMMLTFFEAWVGALAYTFQLYFDFSGYSDMAIGIARMFGIKLPLNFNSPYKAHNIIEFWRRWHMTLSRFLRDYLYIPLGGNKKGKIRRYINLILTMLLGGLWHGAGWTFIVWGLLHGTYLIINHAWHHLRRSFGDDLKKSSLLGNALAKLITFLAIVVAWVFFRAESFSGAQNIIMTMVGYNGFSLPYLTEGTVNLLNPWLSMIGFDLNAHMFQNNLWIGSWYKAADLIVLLLVIVWVAPNSQQIMINFEPALETYHGELRPWAFKWLQWKPSYLWLFMMLMIALKAVYNISAYSEFLYFNF